jgi:hypothetical protein
MRSSQTPSYAHLADSLARLHFVPPDELGSAALRLVTRARNGHHPLPVRERG